MSETIKIVWPPDTGEPTGLTRRQMMDQHGIDPVTGDLCSRRPPDYGTRLTLPKLDGWPPTPQPT